MTIAGLGAGSERLSLPGLAQRTTAGHVDRAHPVHRQFVAVPAATSAGLKEHTGAAFL